MKVANCLAGLTLAFWFSAPALACDVSPFPFALSKRTPDVILVGHVANHVPGSGIVRADIVVESVPVGSYAEKRYSLSWEVPTAGGCAPAGPHLRRGDRVAIYLNRASGELTPEIWALGDRAAREDERIPRHLQPRVALEGLGGEYTPHGEYARGMWRPTPAEMQAAETALRSYLAEPGREIRHNIGLFWAEGWRNYIGERLDSYALQMLGIRAPNRKGNGGAGGIAPPQILINGLCEEEAKRSAPRLGSGLILVNDGGECFFQARYDLEAGKIVQFMVNGMG